jgi:anaerobic magnesium-protoporphyrin IX monomethyl ester cyclase
MRIALIAPASPFLIDQGVHGPLGLWHLGAALKQAGHDVIYCDRGLGDALPIDADVWCLTGTTPQRAEMRKIAEAAPVPLIIGGPHATSASDDVLTWWRRITVVLGEGEVVLPDLIGRNLYAIRRITADRIRDLDALPWPDRSQARRYHYSITDAHGRAHEATTAITSRGCPHHCAFCSPGVWQHRYTARSAENVLGEMGYLETLGYDAVHFFDDSLALDARRLKAICDGMDGMVWRCFVRADQMTEERLHDMARAGCVEIGLGVESGSEAVLEAIHKGERVADQAAAIGWAHRAGVRVKAFIIVGLPGESAQTLAETAKFLDTTQPDDVDVTLLQVYPGADLHRDPAAYGLTVDAEGGWFKGKPGEYHAHHRTEALSAAELLAARDYLEQRFKRWDLRTAQGAA